MESEKKCKQNELGMSLIEAAEEGRLGEVNILLSIEGCNVNYQNVLSTTALIAAASAGEMKVVDRLLQEPLIKVNLKNYYGVTALILFVYGDYKYIDTLKLFLKRSDLFVNLRCNAGGAGPLYLALDEHRPEYAKLLIARGANVAFSVKRLKVNGWYKHLSGEIIDIINNWKQYLPEWTMWNHKYYPDDFKDIVLQWLLVVAKQKYIRKCVNKDMRTFMVQFIAAAYKFS